MYRKYNPKVLILFSLLVPHLGYLIVAIVSAAACDTFYSVDELVIVNL